MTWKAENLELMQSAPGRAAGTDSPNVK
jgi:hypothetical protein